MSSTSEPGIRLARCTIERLMRTYGICGVGPAKTKKTTLRGRALAAAEDLVRRNFTAGRSDELWLADFTYICTWEGWACPAIVLDVFIRRIVGWQLAPHMRRCLVTDAFELAFHARLEHEDGLIVHSDKGSQGEFNRSSQHSSERSCAEHEEAGRGTDWAPGDALTGTSTGWAAGASCAVLDGDRSRALRRGRRQGGSRRRGAHQGGPLPGHKDAR